MMAGEIGVQSREGQGSSFWFTAVFNKQAVTPARNKNDELMRGIKVLIVDDSAANRELMKGFLHFWGCDCTEAANWHSALRAVHDASAAGQPFRVVFLDTEMPAAKGKDFGQEVANYTTWSGAALVVMSSMRKGSDAPHLQETGTAARLPKPIWESSLREALTMALGRREESGVAQVEAGPAPLSIVGTAGTIRILVAEDSLTNQQVARAILRKLGCEVDVVPDGTEAIRALQQRDYDAVLMDCEMPGMDGFEATRRIRQTESEVGNPNLPIVALTGGSAARGPRQMPGRGDERLIFPNPSTLENCGKN